jgi:hypothetical protein
LILDNSIEHAGQARICQMGYFRVYLQGLGLIPLQKGQYPITLFAGQSGLDPSMGGPIWSVLEQDASMGGM